MGSVIGLIQVSAARADIPSTTYRWVLPFLTQDGDVRETRQALFGLATGDNSSETA